MFGASSSGTFAKASHRGSRAFIVLGVVAILFNFFLIAHLFAQRPVFSEEAEIISKAKGEARASMRVEWIAPDAKFSHVDEKDLVMEREQLVSLYRLRVLVVATEAEVTQLPVLLTSLITANYTGRSIPVDVEFHVLGKPTGFPEVTWHHGRFDVYAHRLHGNAQPSLPFVLTDVWQPQSSFELGLPLTAATKLSPNWFQWVQRVIRQYASTSKDDHFRLERAAGQQRRLRSPLSQSLSGMALGMPVAGAAERAAAAAVFSPLPSSVTVFTADYWTALLAHLNSGIDVDDTAAATWKSFMGATAAVVGKNRPQFLYPPAEKSGVLACEDGAKASAGCSVVPVVDGVTLEKLLQLPATLDQIPKMQGQ